MIIPWLILLCLIAVSLSMVIWSFRNNQRLYQFPMLFGSAWLFYMVPQLIGILLNPGKLPAASIENGGLNLALILCVLCAAAGWVGYAWGTRFLAKRPQNASDSVYREEIVFLAGLLLAVAAAWGAWKLAGLSGGFVAQFTGGGHYNLEWKGEAVRYSFFTALFFPAFLLTLFATLRKPSRFRFTAVAIISVYPLATICFLGRRQDTILFFAIIAFALYFSRGWIVPRPVLACGLFLCAVFVVLAPVIRDLTQYGWDVQELRNIEVKKELEKVVKGESYSEVEGLVVHSSALHHTGGYDYGVQFYNAFVRVLVPRQLVGEEQKEALMIAAPIAYQEAVTMYDWEFSYGSFPTGPLTAFRSFWFFGAGLYALFGLLCSFIWSKATLERDWFSQALYVVLAVWIPMSVVDSLTRILPALLVAWVPLRVIFGWAKLTPLISLGSSHRNSLRHGKRRRRLYCHTKES